MEKDWLSILKHKCNSLVSGGRVKADDGTVMYTPDGTGFYPAQWIRDFEYIAEYAPELVPTEDLEAIIRFLIVRVRDDGWIPDRVYGDGHPVYSAGPENRPAGLPNLDNASFLTLLVQELFRRLDADQAVELFNCWEPVLWRGLEVLLYSNEGLVYNDPVTIHSPYGFTDLVGKTGELFMESILCWRAFRALEYMSKYSNKTQVEEYSHRHKKIETSIEKLYDEESGMYFAATETCRQIDVWGNAYLLYSDFPCGEHKTETITKWLADNISEYVFKGQIRHLPRGQYWQRILIENEMEKDTYQNGAYWATASGWVTWCLAQDNPLLAAKVFSDCLTECLQNGFYECVNVHYTKLDNYSVSGTNLLGCVLRLKQEGNAGFFAEVNKLLKNMVM